MSLASSATVEVFAPEHVEAQEERSTARKSSLRRPFLSRIRSSPCRPGDAIGLLGVSFLVADGLSAGSTRNMGGVDGRIGATLWFSTIDARAQEFYSLLSSASNGTSSR